MIIHGYLLIIKDRMFFSLLILIVKTICLTGQRAHSVSVHYLWFVHFLGQGDPEFNRKKLQGRLFSMLYN